VAPEAARGGPIAAVCDGDTIVIDCAERKLDVDLSEEEIAARLESIDARPCRYESGVFAKYAKLVSSPSLGAITHPL
jgi:dihydroxy-acid dehydratase